MQQATTLPAIVRLGYITADAPTVLQDAYRQYCAKKRQPFITITPNVKGFMVMLDMATTGATLNPVGQRVWLQVAQALGLTPTGDGITTNSLATAATVARRLALISQDRRFQGR